MKKSSDILKVFVGVFCFLSQLQAIPVSAASSIVVRFGLFAESISLTELQEIADTGRFPNGFEAYTRRLSPLQQSLIVSALRTNVPINTVTVSKLLNTQIGTTLLKDLSRAIKREDSAGVQALRAALVLGSQSTEGLSILNFIRKYPSQRLEINLEKAFEVTSNFNTAFWQTQRFMVAISPQLGVRKPQINLPFDPSEQGHASVQLLNVTFDDLKRQRQIPVDIYWSDATSADKPVILFTHGLGSHRNELIYLAQHLASRGYAVASVEHPGSNQANIDNAIRGQQNRLMKPQEFLDRPKDISFVLDELSKLNNAANVPFKGKLATNNVMVIGYSFGGSTALTVGGAELQLEYLKKRCKDNLSVFSFGEGIQCIAQELPENRYQFRDNRVKSIMALNPPTSLMFGETGLAKVQIPTFILASSADKTTPALTEQVIGFDKIISPKMLVGIIGATHLSVKDPSATLDQPGQPNTPFSGGEVVGEQATDIRRFLKAIALASAAQLTPEAKKYSIFLTSDYAQYSSTQAFPMRLIREIPHDAKAIIKEFTGDR